MQNTFIPLVTFTLLSYEVTAANRDTLPKSVDDTDKRQNSLQHSSASNSDSNYVYFLSRSDTLIIIGCLSVTVVLAIFAAGFTVFKFFKIKQEYGKLQLQFGLAAPRYSTDYSTTKEQQLPYGLISPRYSLDSTGLSQLPIPSYYLMATPRASSDSSTSGTGIWRQIGDKKLLQTAEIYHFQHQKQVLKVTREKPDYHQAVDDGGVDQEEDIDSNIVPDDLTCDSQIEICNPLFNSENLQESACNSVPVINVNEASNGNSDNHVTTPSSSHQDED